MLSTFYLERFCKAAYEDEFENELDVDEQYEYQVSCNPFDSLPFGLSSNTNDLSEFDQDDYIRRRKRKTLSPLETLKLKLKNLKMEYTENNVTKNDLRLLCSTLVTKEDLKNRQDLEQNVQACLHTVQMAKNEWYMPYKYQRNVIAFDFDKDKSKDLLQKYSNTKLPCFTSIGMEHTKNADEKDLDEFLVNALPSQINNFSFNYQSKTETCWYRSLKVFMPILPSVLQEVDIHNFCFSSYLFSEFMSLLTNAKKLKLNLCEINCDTKFVFDAKVSYKLRTLILILTKNESDYLRKYIGDLKLFESIIDAITRCSLKNNKLKFYYSSSI